MRNFPENNEPLTTCNNKKDIIHVSLNLFLVEHNILKPNYDVYLLKFNLKILNFLSLVGV